MAAGRILFVASAGEGRPASPDMTIVVTDVAWTPMPGARADVVPLRPAAAEVASRFDLFEEALDRLDRWADASGMADRLRVDGVTYWYRLREDAWNWLHERLAWWRLVHDVLAPGGIREISLEVDDQALRDVVEAFDRAAGRAAARPAGTGAEPAKTVAAVAPVGRAAGMLRLLLGRRPAAAIGATPRREEADGRARLLDARVRSLAAERPAPVLVLSHTGIRQVVDVAGAPRLVDANLGAVIDRLRTDGQRPVVVGLGLDHRDDAAWPAIAGDDRLLPQSLLQTRWPGGDGNAAGVGASMHAALDAAPPVALEVEGIDLAPALRARIHSAIDTTLAVSLRQGPRIEALLAELQPRAVLMTHEGIRTPWLVAARRRGVPAFAVQHGALYPTHPGYRHPRRPDLVLPDLTFVFGPYERGVLLEHGGYDSGEVEVSGSPRLDLDPGVGIEPAMREQDRARVRAELGVAEGDRLLVVSTTFMDFVRRFYLAPLLERLLGDPLPGVHLVFKQHPGETDEGPYRAILEGVARSRGNPVQPITVVRDVDLYRLLRAADAHLGLHSTVLTDAVRAGTPNLVAVDQAHADLLGYVAAGVATAVRTSAELRAAVADPQAPEPAARRVFLDAHFRPGDASGRIVAAIAERAGAG